ncbi:MAG: branched-chain amino acid ABC transporter permease [Chloroflexota bacterium]
MNPGLLLQQILNGLSIGSVYAIFALGYTLVFSILRIINLSHGALFTLGAYFTYVLTGEAFGFNGLLARLALPFGLPFPIAMLLGAVSAGLVGVVVERLAFKPLRDQNADPLLTLVSSLGVAVLIVNLIQFLVGAEIYSYPASALNSFNLFGLLGNLPAAINFGGEGQAIPVRTIQIIIFIVGMVILMALTYFINYTKTGKALRAIAEDPVTASLLGIHIDFFVMLTFFLSGLLGGIAGALVGLSVSIAGPYFGIAFGLKGLAVIVLGGLGSIPGAVIGGLIIGLAEAFVPANLVAYKEVIAFAALFVILLIRPRGLLGRALIQKV